MDTACRLPEVRQLWNSAWISSRRKVHSYEVCQLPPLQPSISNTCSASLLSWSQACWFMLQTRASCTCPFSLPQFVFGCRNALNATGRPIHFSLCEWGVSQPELWGALSCCNVPETLFPLGPGPGFFVIVVHQRSIADKHHADVLQQACGVIFGIFACSTSAVRAAQVFALLDWQSIVDALHQSMPRTSLCLNSSCALNNVLTCS